ncbi:MAG: HRDC domain-containing protein [Candidatus Nanopelagicales bacterium]|jgi:ribonuclease D|nr:HRDC domain-containing protein [Candidatus Nanopelagicales bacterium]
MTQAEQELAAPARAGAPAPGTGAADPEPPPVAPLPPLTLRDGLPELIETPEALAAALDALAGGTGPIAVDTERASGYRYGQRAYLVQLRREGAGTLLVDPVALPDVPGLAAALHGAEWVLHAASQDLPCLAELGLRPRALFDTELAGRLLGMPRVGLAPMVEALLGRSLAKGHGAADWSKRPLPRDWLEYAALDVEVLIELRDLLEAQLVAAGKAEWAAQEFAAVRDAPPAPPRADPWRRTSGIHRIRSRRGLAVVQHLWHARDEIAAEVDSAPGRLLPDASIVAVAHALPRDPAALRALKGFTGRGAGRYHRAWSRALRAAWEVPEQELPDAALRGDGPPPPRAWAQRDPAAAGRLGRARNALAARADALSLPVENLVTPELVRRLAWQPPATVLDPDPDVALAAVAAFLAQGGARPWQVEQVAPLIADAVRGG